MRTVKSLAIVAASLAMFSLPSHADVSEATHVLQADETYSPIDVKRVKVFVFNPDVPFKVIGSIEARGMATADLSTHIKNLGKILSLQNMEGPGEKEDMALAIRALKTEAASIGANGVIILQQKQVRVNENSTERRITGAAIRY